MNIISDHLIEKKFSVSCTVTTYSNQFVSRIFKLASSRLLDINNWHRLSESLLPFFVIVDEDGIAQDRPARQNDFIRILSISSAQRISPDESLKVEFVRHENDPAEDSETLSIGVSAITDPLHLTLRESGVFMNEATTIFRVTRRGLNITAELVNAADPELELFENPVLGVFRVQWRSFVNGLLNNLR